MNTFARYSFARFTASSAHRPSATGGGPELVSLGGNSKVTNQSLAVGVDYTLSNTSVLDFRFGFFKYGVDVLPIDFGTTPAADVGIPGLNSRRRLHLRAARRLHQRRRGRHQLRLRPGRSQPLQLPAGRAREAVPVRRQPHEELGNHTVKFGVDIRRAYNLRVPSDTHRSGELDFNDRAHARARAAAASGLATFLLGDVSDFRRYVSTSTDARERQWRQFYYAQDTWRATPKLTLNYGAPRSTIINPQTVNEAGNGGWLDLNTGEILVAGVGDVDLNGNVKNKINWAPAPRRHLPAQRQDGDPRGLRPQLRHRRVRVHVRPHRDAEPARAGACRS